MGKVIVVVGGQFGSEAKGHISAYLGDQVPVRELMAIRVGGPNAGHTVVDVQDNHHAFRQLPVAAIRQDAGGYQPKVAIAAGSEIDPPVLAAEMAYVQAYLGVVPQLSVDAQATVIVDEDKQVEMEVLQKQIGSTAKGIGAARASRLMRQAPTWGEQLDFSDLKDDVAGVAYAHLEDGGTVLIEGTQGYGLGLHAGYYPYCTSGDARAIDFLAQVGLSPWDPAIDELEVWVVFRSYPIRVAGNSGPLLGELTWEEMNRITHGYVTQPEYTTVTKKPRRIGTWDPDLANRALNANGRHHAHVALTFADYIEPGLAGVHSTPGGVWAWADTGLDWLTRIEQQIGHSVELLGTGPASIIDRRT